MKRDENYQKVILWETRGHSIFKTIEIANIRGTLIMLFVIDVSDPDSLQGIQHIVEKTSNLRGAKPKQYLVGNKIDLTRQISQEKCKKFAKENDMGYLEVTATLHESV